MTEEEEIAEYDQKTEILRQELSVTKKNMQEIRWKVEDDLGFSQAKRVYVSKNSEYASHVWKMPKCVENRNKKIALANDIERIILDKNFDVNEIIEVLSANNTR